MECTLCGQSVDSVAHIAEQWLLDRIRERNPDWVAEDGGCAKCLAYYRDLDDTVEILPSEDA